MQINNNFTALKTVIAWVLQISICGTHLSNLFMNNIALIMTEAMPNDETDDIKLFSIGKDIDKIKVILSIGFTIVTNCFLENFLNSKNITLCVLQKIDKLIVN